jgi:hypothetical protein
MLLSCFGACRYHVLLGACSHLNATDFSLTSGAALSGPLRSAGAALETWDCMEQGGFIWLFFGDRDTPHEERPAVPSVPELALPGALHASIAVCLHELLITAWQQVLFKLATFAMMLSGSWPGTVAA